MPAAGRFVVAVGCTNGYRSSFDNHTKVCIPCDHLTSFDNGVVENKTGVSQQEPRGVYKNNEAYSYTYSHTHVTVSSKVGPTFVDLSTAENGLNECGDSFEVLTFCCEETINEIWF